MGHESEEPGKMYHVEDKAMITQANSETLEGLGGTAPVQRWYIVLALKVVHPPYDSAGPLMSWQEFASRSRKSRER